MTERQQVLPFDADPGEPATEAASREQGAPAPAVLDRTIIGVVVLREVDRALALYPTWVHPFAGLSFNRARRTYGQAHRDGRIVLSSVFLGTAALGDLEDTVRHELAHLIVGIDQRHGPAWRQVAKRLGATPRATGRSQAPDLAQKMEAAPYTLMAVLASGEEREVKPVFRRSKRYLDYRYRVRGRNYIIAGQTVLRFYYADRGRDPVS